MIKSNIKTLTKNRISDPLQFHSRSTSPPPDTLRVGQSVQVEHCTHLVDLTVTLADRADVVTNHEVCEIRVEALGLRHPEAEAQLQQAVRPQVAQSKRLRHDVFEAPVRPLFLVGFRQIQIVLPDILQGGTEKRKKSVF